MKREVEPVETFQITPPKRTIENMPKELKMDIEKFIKNKYLIWLYVLSTI